MTKLNFNMRFVCSTNSRFYIDRDNITNLFFSDVKKYPILTEEETIELVNIMNNAESEEERNKAKQRLVECNLRFVISIAKKIGTNETFMDLVNEGCMGLIKAIEKFDAKRKCHLISYAVSWIVVYMRNYQITKVNSVIPPNALKLHQFVKKVTHDFFKENERNPTEQEISEIVYEKYKFKIPFLEDVELGHMISIEEQVNNSIGECETIENTNMFLSKTSSNNVQDMIDNEYQKDRVGFFLGKLNARERFIVEKLYGINCTPETYDSIGKQINLCTERVRQIYKTAIGKMQKFKNEY